MLMLAACSSAAEPNLMLGKGTQSQASGAFEPGGPLPERPTAGPSVIQTTVRSLAVAGLIAYVTRPYEEPHRMARLLDNSFLETPVDAGDVYGSGLTLGSGALGIYLLGRATGSQSLQAAGSDLGRSLVASGAAVWSMKLAFGRTRPNGGRYSFPSGHTAAAFSVVPAIRKHFGLKAAVPACALALSAGLGRMEDRKHYLSDVIFGAALGLAIGEAVVGSSSDWPLGRHVSLGPSRVGVTFGF
jgi:hypothetical protein